MALALLQSVFCSCWRAEEEVQPQTGYYDETTHLIPEEIEPPVTYSNFNGSLVDYQKLQERLTDIVRSKQSKMVNVASRIPFNLHNQSIPKADSGSRSASRSIDDRYDSRYTYSDYHYSTYDYRPRVNNMARGNGSRSPSPSPYAGPSNGGEQQDEVTEQPKPTPILNIRLVGYKDTEFRGRTRARGPVPSGLPSLGQPKPQVEDATTPVANAFPNIEVTTPTQQQPIPVFQLQAPPSMTVSW